MNVPCIFLLPTDEHLRFFIAGIGMDMSGTGTASRIRFRFPGFFKAADENLFQTFRAVFMLFQPAVGGLLQRDGGQHEGKDGAQSHRAGKNAHHRVPEPASSVFIGISGGLRNQGRSGR